MKNKKLNTIDMDEINKDCLGEGLLEGVLTIKQYCRNLDKQIARISLSFTPYDSIMECYSTILDKIAIKNELTGIYKLFIKWYKHLDSKHKKFYMSYYVIKDAKFSAKIAGTSRYYKKFILPMARSFLGYIKVMSNFTEEMLLTNPYVYKLYMTTSYKREWANRK